MTLTLLAVSLNDQPLSQPITAHFDGRGGTIGRADHNTMALPDPERHISRLQAEVVGSGDAFVIRNVGAANPITVAGRALARGDMAPLGHGDEVRIGGYLLQVDSRTQSAALDVTRGRAMLAEPTGGNAPLRHATLGSPTPVSRSTTPTSPAASNPFADLFALAPAVSTPSVAAAAASAPVPSPAASPSPRAAPSSDPFADLFGAPGSSPQSGAFGALQAPQPVSTPLSKRAAPAADDPFSSLLPPPAGVPAASSAFERPRAAPSAGVELPEHFDPFASQPSPSPAGPVAASDPFADLMPAAALASIDTMFGLGGGAVGGGDLLANFMAGAPPARPGAAGGAALTGALAVSADPFEALFGGAHAAPAAAPAEPDHVPALNAAFSPPRLRNVPEEAMAAVAPAVAPLPEARPPLLPPLPPLPALPPPPLPSLPPRSPPPLPVAASPPPLPSNPVPLVRAAEPSPKPQPEPRAALAHDTPEAVQLWAALCQGAGVNLPLPTAGVEAQLRDIGRILRSAIDGSLRLMAVRTSTRHEMRANVTVIQARNNNPLKFSPDAQSALEALLQPSLRGFLDGPAAMEDAMQDLVGHSIGSVAGMRAALEGVLDRFAPEQLEGKLTSKSVLDNVLPGARKARLWDLYLQHQGTIRDEAQDDFHALFGKAFLAAYEQQVAQLKRNARAPLQAPSQGPTG